MDINVAGLWKMMPYLAVYHCNLILSRLCSCIDVFNHVWMCLIMYGCQRSPEHGFKLLRPKDKSCDACYKLGHIFSQHDHTLTMYADAMVGIVGSSSRYIRVQCHLDFKFRVNTTSRKGIKQLGISSGSIFLLFFVRVTEGHFYTSPGPGSE